MVFSAALLAILTAHEMGHYVACRRYGVAATLPFFIPAPPLFLAGTFGAFIKIKSPIPSRRALFDIGLAGPLAGFVVAVPIALVGVLSMQPAGARWWLWNRISRPAAISLAGQIGGFTSRSLRSHQPLLHGCMDWLTGHEPESDAGGTTRWWARNLCHLWPSGSQSYRSSRFRGAGGTGSPGICLVWEPERISLYGFVGHHAAGGSSATRRDGTSGTGSCLDRSSHSDRLRALLLAVPNHHHLNKRSRLLGGANSLTRLH